MTSRASSNRSLRSAGLPSSMPYAPDSSSFQPAPIPISSLPPEESASRFHETVEIVLKAWTEEKLTFSGKHFRFEDVEVLPRPVQQPHPPVCIGGSGERRTLRTAARFAQHWNFVGGPPEEFARKRDVLHAHCRDIGRDPGEIMLSSHIRLGPGGDPGPVVDAAAALGEQGLDLAIVVLPPPHDPSVLTPLAEALAQLR